MVYIHYQFVFAAKDIETIHKTKQQNASGEFVDSIDVKERTSIEVGSSLMRK